MLSGCRFLRFAAAGALETSASKLEGILESILHELKVDDAA